MKMKVLHVTLTLFLLLGYSVLAQNKTVLFTVDGEPVYTNEFKRVYSKNLDLVKDDSQKDIDNYLKLFVNYKLKIAEAKALGLDQKPSYIREFKNYKNQLSKNYLNDNKVTEQLIKEAYNRLQTEVDASHILVRIDENASPQDTLLAYQEIQKLRGRVLQEGFEAVKKDIHNGRTLFAEELGYFTAFKMVYPFENAVYNTPVGEWSQPFRTQFGYHIVWTKDKRDNRGEVTVAHIMLTENEKAEQSAKDRIEELYKRVKQGEDFAALAKQFSDDKSSSANGGKLNTFSAGQLSSKIFEEQAFSLQNVNDVTKPFKSEFGYHIIKLHEKNGIKPFSQLEPELKNRIKRDSRSKVIEAKRIDKLMAQYNVSTQTDLTPIVAILNDDFFTSTWKIPSDFKGEETLLTIGNKTYTQYDFADFLEKSQRRRQAKVPLKKLVDDNYKVFVESNLKTYQEDNLEFENEEYAQILSEYRDGLLLFDLMETEIWNAAKQDSIGLQEYYLLNKDKYYYNPRVDAIVASSAKKNIIKRVETLLENNKTIEVIQNGLNSDTQINVSFIVDTLEVNHQALPKGLNLTEGVSKIYKHNDAYTVIKIKEVLPKMSKTFNEAKGNVISDYQDQKEQDWLANLSKKYKVVINQEALKQVKEELK
ncbi:peptidylprolyl isomerase [Olleya aquimaris]|uniref:Peptidyl-prolyl cis-trans isomerase SurA n=1 Tax=Olleya aquimaris TaxID=639310 RepID=A0A327RA09_9FLAO|nr:peptidylprolyl isomerase [Olleya aquimaris]RAJ12945.1 peptidyl-prolyl cis-trans isomerase SurA [Olleya aquimaris]